MELSSLPTPPGTGHRQKETRRSSVLWSPNLVASLILKTPAQAWVVPAASASRALPVRSILKPTIARPLATIEENARETTPEPDDPLSNLTYLASPVSTIIATSHHSLREIVDAYTTLATRVRAATANTEDVDSTWPLFEPVRKHSAEFVQALVRDLARALVDPSTAAAVLEDEETEVMTNECLSSSLPSPKQSPRGKKAKQGMSAEQVKYARDLCNIVHSVLKLLALLFATPAVYAIFSNAELDSILVQVIAIPMAEHIPTPNARKTCALAIWLLQGQRLPFDVLYPAQERIASALRRGIKGQLGKEGKKGSISDGLRAVHDLSLYQPGTFIAPFAELLPSILEHLLAPTLAMRAQACHSLGGFTFGMVSLKPSSLRASVSRTVVEYLMATPLSPAATPRRTESLIVRTLKTTLNNPEPTQQAAQGPVWALCVLANFIVLAGPSVSKAPSLTRAITTLVSLSMRHKKSSIRALGSVIWRCMTWVYLQASWPTTEKGEDSRATYWKLVRAVVDYGSGVSIVAALLTHGRDGEDDVRRALGIVGSMIQKGGFTTNDGMETLKTLVNSEVEPPVWDLNALLASGLFSCHPGVMTADAKSLPSAVRFLYDECPSQQEVRPLTPEEISTPWIFDQLVELFLCGLSNLELTTDTDHETPVDILTIWDGLLRQPVVLLKEKDEDVAPFAERVIEVLVQILQSPDIELHTVAPLDILPVTTSSSPSKPATTHVVGARSPPKTKRKLHLPIVPEGSSSRPNEALKLMIVRDLWVSAKSTIPPTAIGAAASTMLAYLVEHHHQLLGGEDEKGDAQNEWAMLCAEVLLVCDLGEVRAFLFPGDEGYSNGEFNPTLWKQCAEKWTVDQTASWEYYTLLLEAPHAEKNRWEMSTEDCGLWDILLQHTVNRAAEYNVDSISVVDSIARDIAELFVDPASTASTRIADSLLSKSDMSDARQTPEFLLQLVNDTLVHSYPPPPRDLCMSSWLLGSLANVFVQCPHELIVSILEGLELGLSTWIADEHSCYDLAEYDSHVVTLYEALCVSLQNLSPLTVSDLEKTIVVLENGFMGRKDKPRRIRTLFAGLWRGTYDPLDEPVEGWSPRVRACLLAAGISSDADAELDALLAEDEVATFEVASHSIVDEEQVLEFSDSDDGHVLVLSAKLGLSSTPAPAFTPSLRQAEENFSITTYPLPEMPATPTRPGRILSKIFTPPRPTKTPVFYAPSIAVPTSPGSPVPGPSSQSNVPSLQTVVQDPSIIPPLFAPGAVFTTPKRTACTPGATPSPKRRRIGDSEELLEDTNKENGSPRITFVLVADRIGLPSVARPTMSPAVLNVPRPPVRPFQLEKRKFLEDAESMDGEEGSELEERPLKRMRLNLPPSQSHGAEAPRPESHEAPIIPPLSVQAPIPALLAPAPVRQKRRMLVASVEVPTLRSLGLRGPRPSSMKAKVVPPVLRPTVSMGAIALASTSTPAAVKRPLRITRSALKLHGAAAFSEPSSGLVSRKRKRIKSDSEEDPFCQSSLSSDDVSLPSDGSVIPMLDSDDLDVQACNEAGVPSSDDDPHAGQVTPHHLISPTLQRLRDENYEDPPSDDSVVSVASPSRDAVTRKIQTKLRFGPMPPRHKPPVYKQSPVPSASFVRLTRPRTSLPSELDFSSNRGM